MRGAKQGPLPRERAQRGGDSHEVTDLAEAQGQAGPEGGLLHPCYEPERGE